MNLTVYLELNIAVLTLDRSLKHVLDRLITLYNVCMYIHVHVRMYVLAMPVLLCCMHIFTIHFNGT